MKLPSIILVLVGLIARVIAHGCVTNITVPNVTAPADITADETTLLNYALAVENLQNAFYVQALSRFSEADFNAAGFPPSVRNGYARIAQNKQSHVALLNQKLGISTTSPCNYAFPYNNVTSFVELSQKMENIGTSAYIGILPGFKNSTYSTVAASILAADARSASWIGSNVTGVDPWSGPLDPPLSPGQVISLATPYVTSCPSDNLQLPFPSFQTVALTPSASPGSSVPVSIEAASTDNLSVAFLNGLAQTIVPIENGNVVLPSDLTGTVYAMVISSNADVTNQNIIAGPAVLTFPVHFNEANHVLPPCPSPTPMSTITVTAALPTSAVPVSTVTVTAESAYVSAA